MRSPGRQSTKRGDKYLKSGTAHLEPGDREKSQQRVWRNAGRAIKRKHRECGSISVVPCI